MFKKFVYMLLPLVALTAGPAAAELKIASLDVQRAIGESEEAKAAVEKLQDELGSEQKALQDLNAEITGLQERLRKDGEVLSDSEKRKLQKDIEDKQIDYQFQVNKLQKALNDRQQEIISAMAPKLDAVLKDIIAVEGYDLIVHRQNVLYVNSKHDITPRVTEKLNEKQ